MAVFTLNLAKRSRVYAEIDDDDDDDAHLQRDEVSLSKECMRLVTSV